MLVKCGSVELDGFVKFKINEMVFCAGIKVNYSASSFTIGVI
jgi:hypothetical protein